MAVGLSNPSPFPINDPGSQRITAALYSSQRFVLPTIILDLLHGSASLPLQSSIIGMHALLLNLYSVSIGPS